LRARVLERPDRQVLPRVVVAEAARQAKLLGRSEIAALEDDALRQHDTGMRFGAGHGIANRGAHYLDVVAAFDARPDAVEREVERHEKRPVYFRPGPAKDAPRAADFA